MQAVALEGFWLLAAFAVVYLVGVFTAQYAKDKIFGVPADLCAALKTMEAGALTELKNARAKLVADTIGLIAKGKAAASVEVAKVVAPVAPAPAPVAGVAASALSPVQ